MSIHESRLCLSFPLNFSLTDSFCHPNILGREVRLRSVAGGSSLLSLCSFNTISECFQNGRVAQLKRRGAQTSSENVLLCHAPCNIVTQQASGHCVQVDAGPLLFCFLVLQILEQLKLYSL